MDTSLYFTDFGLPLLDERLLVGQLVWRQVTLQDLGLTLVRRWWYRCILTPTTARSDSETLGVIPSNDVRRMGMLILNCKLYSLHNSSLPSRADLLSTLKCNKRQLEIVRRLLQRCLLLWLEIWLSIETEPYRGRVRTKLACNEESVFRSSDPRLAMLRVASVKSCLNIR